MITGVVSANFPGVLLNYQNLLCFLDALEHLLQNIALLNLDMDGILDTADATVHSKKARRQRMRVSGPPFGLPVTPMSLIGFAQCVSWHAESEGPDIFVASFEVAGFFEHSTTVSE